MEAREAIAQGLSGKRHKPAVPGLPWVPVGPVEPAKPTVGEHLPLIPRLSTYTDNEHMETVGGEDCMQEPVPNFKQHGRVPSQAHLQYPGCPGRQMLLWLLDTQHKQ